MIETSRITNSEETPEWLDALERKHQALALKEVKARERAGLVVTPKWLDALERKYQALAMLEIANRASGSSGGS